MTMYGASTEELRRLAEQFSAAADDLDLQASTLSGVLQSFEWLGDIASDFRGDWRGEMAPTIGSSVAYLREASRDLRLQADEQEAASKADAGTFARLAPGDGTRIPEPDPESWENNVLFFHWGDWDRLEFADTPLFGGDPGEEINPSDVRQGGLGDCSFLATLATMASTSAGQQQLARMVHDNGDGTFTVTFPDGEAVTVDDTFYATNGHLMYAGVQKDKWVAVVEEAYAKKNGGYDQIDSLYPFRVLTDLGFPSTESSVGELTDTQLSEIVTSGDPVVFSANLNQEGGFVSNYAGAHAFSLVDSSVDPQGVTWVTVRNPWGHNENLALPKGAIMVDKSDGTIRMPLDVAQRTFYAVSVADS